LEHGQLGLVRWSILINEGMWAPRDFDVLIIELLNYALLGKVSKILLGEPPRHGKSTLISKNFASYFLAHFPNDNIILSSYGQQLASEFGRQVKDVINTYGHLSPYNVKLADDSKANNRFNMKRPYDGRMLSVGAAGSILGFGAGLFIIDDPIKSPADARSKTLQDRLREWIGGTAKTRLEKRVDGKPPIMIVDAQRLDVNDLHGIIKENEPVISANEAFLILRNGGSIDPNTWVDLNLPAICEDPENDLLDRKKGQVLWPEQMDINRLNAEKSAIGSFLFNAIYQGDPTQREGKIFKPEWFLDDRGELLPEILINSNFLPDKPNQIRYWDFAASGEGGDSAAGFKSTFFDDILVFRELVHDKFTAREMLHTYETITLKDGKSVPSIIEQEPASMSKMLIQKFLDEPQLQWFDIQSDKVSLNKLDRSFDLEVMAETGRIKFDTDTMTIDDIKKAIHELINFTGEDGGEDNIVDTMTGSARIWKERQPTKIYM